MLVLKKEETYSRTILDSVGSLLLRKDSADDLVKYTQAIVSFLSDSWYVETYNKWITRHRKCVEIAGDYVKKVRRSMDLNVA